MKQGKAHARLLALAVLPSRCPCPQDIPNYKFTGLAWLFMGVANSDATLYDDEFQAMKKAYPNQVPPAALHSLPFTGCTSSASTMLLAACLCVCSCF